MHPSFVLFKFFLHAKTFYWKTKKSHQFHLVQRTTIRCCISQVLLILSPTWLVQYLGFTLLLGSKSSLQAKARCFAVNIIKNWFAFSLLTCTSALCRTFQLWPFADCCTGKEGIDRLADNHDAFFWSSFSGICLTCTASFFWRFPSDEVSWPLKRIFVGTFTSSELNHTGFALICGHHFNLWKCAITVVIIIYTVTAIYSS